MPDPEEPPPPAAAATLAVERRSGADSRGGVGRRRGAARRSSTTGRGAGRETAPEAGASIRPVESAAPAPRTAVPSTRVSGGAAA